MAIFATIEHAATFTIRYLGGEPLRETEVARVKPTTERYRSSYRYDLEVTIIAMTRWT